MANEDTQIDAAVEPSNTPEAPVLETPAFVENESNVADGTEGEPPVQEAAVSVDVTMAPKSWARRLWWIHSIYALALGVLIPLATDINVAGGEMSWDWDPPILDDALTSRAPLGLLPCDALSGVSPMLLHCCIM